MNAKTLRKAMYILILFSISLLVACAKYETRWVPEAGGFIPVEMLDADKALAEARGKGLDQACPEEYNAAKLLLDKAFQTYGRCNSKEAVALAKEAMAKADALCPKSESDSDGDGVVDSLDQCPGTGKWIRVDKKGCPLDDDKDGVPNHLDQCPLTPADVKVDAKGCPPDSDGDGVYDYLDKCPGTPTGVKVDSKGCPLDTDGDGVYDYLDKCPGTPLGAEVDSRGCWVLKGLYFDTNKSDIKSQYNHILDAVTSVMKKNPDLKIEIQGHTDSVGDAKYNQKLSERRAQAVLEYFAGKGISRSRMSAIGYGESKPIATNETKAGQAQNRRVELKPVN